MPLWSDASGFAPLGGFNVALCGAFLPSTSYDLLPYAEWDPINGPSTFGYDLSGRRTSLVTPVGKFTYSYDAADELLVQNTPTGSVSYGYDPNGSRTYQKSTTATTTYLWDPRNRLQQVTLPTGSLYTQTYRPDDMRLSESSSTGISTMVWSNNDVLGVVATQSGSPMQQVFALTPVSVPVSVSGHAGGAGGGLPLPHSPTPSLVRAMGRHADGSAINRAYHLDNQGGVLAITTGSGSIEADYHTDSWGNVISGTAADNPYVYLGGLGYWQDANLSLNYVRARWQEASTGSWLSVDSVRSEPRYLYAHNSPTRLVDASGRQSPAEKPIKLTPDEMELFADDPGDPPEFDLMHPLAFIRWQVKEALYDQTLQFKILAREFISVEAQNYLEDLIKRHPKMVTAWEPNWRAFRDALPDVIRPLLPLTLRESPLYFRGLIIGIADGLCGLLPLSMIDQFLDVFTYLQSHPKKGLLDYAWEQIKPLLDAFTNEDDLPPLERGRIAGVILTNIVSIIISIIIEVAAHVPEGLGTSFSFGELDLDARPSTGRNLHNRLAGRSEALTNEARELKPQADKIIQEKPTEAKALRTEDPVAKAKQSIKKKAPNINKGFAKGRLRDLELKVVKGKRENYYFRGTTESFAGNHPDRPITSTATDPIAATAFSVEANTRAGGGVVYIATRQDLKLIQVVRPNVFSVAETEVAVGTTPSKFAEMASIKLSTERARTILSDMGVHDVPQRIYSRARLDQVLREIQHLTPSGVDDFVRRARLIRK